MKLVKLSYISPDWELQDLELDSVNLIVAKNATGKSRTLITIQLLIKIITQKFDWFPQAKWNLTFVNSENKILIYKFETVEINNKGSVVFESLSVDNEEVVKRNNDSVAIISNRLSGGKEEINPPLNKLVLHTNRDVKKYPFLEELCTWADESYGCFFANINSYSKTSQTEYFYSTLGDHSLPALYKTLNQKSKESVLKELNNIGYEISNIKPIEDLEKNVALFISENNLEKPVFHFQLSQGTFRTLSIIVYFEYLFTQKKPAMVVIDDLCEGLDYERATKLGKLVFDKCLNSNIQLVATSNDSFLMEVIDIKYWNVLQRSGKVVTALNIKNHPKVFSDFRFTGLSNFDFFSSDYLLQKLAS